MSASKRRRRGYLGPRARPREPLVAAAWIGLAVKTDGAAVAGGGITESLILAKSGSGAN